MRRFGQVGLWVLLVAAVAHDLWVIPRRPAGDRLADLDVYAGSVRSLLHGGSLYDFHAANGAPFTYPPFAGLVLLPTGLVDLKVAWTVLTVAAGALLVLLVARRFFAVAALGLACSAPFISNLRFGQVSVFVVLLALVDCLDLPPPRWRGLALGIAAGIKLTPLVFVPYLWLTGRRRAAVTALSVFAGTVLVGALVLPSDTWRWLTREAWNTDRIGNLAQPGNQSLNGLLLRLEVPSRLVLLALSAVVLVSAYRHARRLDRLTGFVVVGAAGLAVSPVSWTHHQFVLYLAAVPLVLSGRRWAVITGVVVAAIMIVPLDLLAAVGLGESRVLLAVAIALVPAAWWPAPRIDSGPSSPTFASPVGLDSPPSMRRGRG